MESFRCIHAARVLLDHPLRGSGAVAGDVRRVIEDATFVSFENIIDACLVHNVDGLLLSGEIIDVDNKGLRGPAALVRGMGRLAERDIAVVLDAGPRGQWTGWPAGLRFPPNAHRLGPDFEGQVSMARQGQLRATITAEDPSVRLHDATSNWQIQLPEAQGTFRTFPLISELEPAQGLDPQATGPHGCALIEFEAGRAPRQTRIATAPVRWECFDIPVSVEMSRDDLVQEMAATLEKASRNACEKVWLVGWTVSGEGALVESLSRPRFRDSLIAELAQLDPLPGIHVHTYSLRASTPLSAVRRLAVHDELANEFAARLDARFARPGAALRDCLAGSTLRGGPWESKMETLLVELHAEEVAREANRMASEWLEVPEASS
jgi:hypothetical protein